MLLNIVLKRLKTKMKTTEPLDTSGEEERRPCNCVAPEWINPHENKPC